MKYTLTVTIDTDKEFQDLHIISGNKSVNYGDSNYDEGMTVNSIADCVSNFLKEEIKLEF